MKIGPYQLKNNLILAPMAGVTDRPFRILCRSLGAGLTVSEMVSSDPALRHSRKTQLRMDHKGEPAPISVQIAGAVPEWMADAARFNVDQGAQIIDINMGCPAKKVCNRLAGSALMQDEKLVAEILEAVVNAVEVPVTLKMRTGWDQQHKNAPNIAAMAEQCGIQALTIHGRTRACAYKGQAEYETISNIKQLVKIPVIANGDIVDEVSALKVLQQTEADGIMIGRAAQGNPWIFQHIDHYLKTGEKLQPLTCQQQLQTILTHIENLYDFYGEYSGIRIARKHISWYCKTHKTAARLTAKVNQIETAAEQVRVITDYFLTQTQQEMAA